MKKKNFYYFLVMGIILLLVFLGVQLALNIIEEESQRQNINKIQKINTEVCLKL